jgi:hypothetical protein
VPMPRKWDPSVPRYKRLSPEAKQRHIDRVNARVRADPARHAEYARRTYWRLKMAAIQALGGKCVVCETVDPLVLSVNHVSGREASGDGRKARDLYRAVASGETEGFDLRCMNHQRHWEYERGALLLPTSVEFAFLREIVQPQIKG